MSNPSSNYELLSDLLIQRATSGLSKIEEVELKRLLEQQNVDDDLSFDAAVCAVDQSRIGKGDEMLSMPAHLRSLVISESANYVGAAVATEESVVPGSVMPGSVMRSQPSAATQVREMLGWLAAAACLILAAFAWYSKPAASGGPDVANQTGSNQTGANQNGANQTPLIAEKSAIDFEDFKIDASRIFEVAMDPGNDETGKDASATVYWDEETKRGFVKVAGLNVNDPAVEQYQLWVIDKKRGVADRPNAGVFDIAESGEAIFEFRSELKVFEAQGFAVTVEKPGGVAVSDLSRIALANLGG